MKLTTRIWLLLGTLMLVVMGIDLAVSYQRLTKELRGESEADSRAIYGLVMAMRKVYSQQFQFSELPVTEKTVGFLPAHSLPRISKEFSNWSKSGIIINTVSDRPRNASNQADKAELLAMDWFRLNREAKERSEVIEVAKGQKYFLYTAPLWVEKPCLRCHGNEEDAPPSIRSHYSDAYDYKVGDLRGLISIRIPEDEYERRVRDIWGAQVIKEVIGYFVMFIALGVLLNRLVSRRLERLREGAEKFAEGLYATRVQVTGNDELSTLSQTFNAMAAAVEQREQSLTMLTQAMEQSPESIIITDLDGRIEYVNEEFVRNTGYSRDEAIGKNPSLINSGHTPEATFLAMWATLARGETWRGELINRRKDGSEFTEQAIIAPVRMNGATRHYLAIKQDISEKKEAAAAIEQLVNFDPLTELPNRTLLADRLRQALAMSHRQPDRTSALISFNIDRFKAINDACGSASGDQLLVAVAARIGSLLREGDTLARLAADEFAILLPDVGNDRESASRNTLLVVRKLHDALRQPFTMQEQAEITLTASLGVALLPESEQDQPGEVLRRANTALHRAKANGGNQSAFFEASMGEVAENRFKLENELRRAIQNNELRLFLQPQFSPEGKVVGGEALVRWQHPTRGLLTPVHFIAQAEESDLIVELGIWVMTEACRLIGAETGQGSPFRLSVNISPRHFKRDDFVPWLTDLLASRNVRPDCLILEVTEGLMIDDIDSVIAKMSHLAGLGIRFSLDDFGTGYSSLSHLKRLPIHELKIDRSFVQDAPGNPGDAALVDTILSVARHMNLQVVAEGVETEDQACFLDLRGRVVRQGYLYGRPAPIDEWLEKWR